MRVREEIEVLETLDEVEREEWAPLARGRSVYATWEWYRSLEREDAFEPRYLVARSSSGRLAGALPAYTTTGGGNPRYYPDVVFDGLWPEPLAGASAWVPGVSGGSRAAYLTELLVAPEADARSVASDLLAALHALAEDRQAKAAWIFYVPPADVQLLAEVAPPETLVAYGVIDMELPIRWSSFEDYLGSLSARRRSAVRRELRAFEESGATIATHRLDEVVTAVAPLMAATQTRHGRPTTAAEAEDLLAYQARFLGPWSRVFVCTRGGRTIGFSLFYELERRLYARLVGFDYERLGGSEYFNVLFYAPLVDAIDRGVERIHLGIESYEAKLGRGAEPRPLWCFVRHLSHDLRPLRARARDWSADRLEEVERRYLRFLDDDARRRWAAARAVPSSGEQREG